MAIGEVKLSNDQWVFEISAIENSRPYPTKKEAHDAGIDFASKMKTAKELYRQALIDAAKAEAPKPQTPVPKVSPLPGPHDGSNLAAQQAYLAGKGRIPGE